METTTKISDKASRRHNDTFLSDAVHEPRGLIGYRDGFRFGIGFMLAQLTLALFIGGVAWGIVTALHIR